MKHLNSSRLLQETKDLVKQELSVTFQILKYLEEIERRALHLELGYGSLTEFGIKYLHYSEPQMQRRLAAMHAMKDLPEVQKKVEAGSISLTTLTSAARVFNQKTHTQEQKSELLLSLENLPSREVEKVLNLQSHSLSFFVDDELRAQLEELKNLWGCSLSDAIRRMAKNTFQTLSERKTRPTPIRPQTPTPSADLKRQVKAAAPACTFKSPGGRVCGSRFGLEVDHVEPWALGGQTRPENLRTLCRAHNRFRSRKTFGAKGAPTRGGVTAQGSNALGIGK